MSAPGALDGWLGALGAGVLIGLAATLLLLGAGRIAGISGMLHGLTRRSPPAEWSWRAAFLLGMIAAGALAMHLLGQHTASPASDPALLVAGLLVGYGSALGNGCTSGHGVCGIGRLSRRSIVAVLVFMTAAMVTVFVLRHMLGGA